MILIGGAIPPPHKKRIEAPGYDELRSIEKNTKIKLRKTTRNDAKLRKTTPKFGILFIFAS